MEERGTRDVIEPVVIVTEPRHRGSCTTIRFVVLVDMRMSLSIPKHK